MRGSETVSDVREGDALSTQAVYRPIIWKGREGKTGSGGSTAFARACGRESKCECPRLGGLGR